MESDTREIYDIIKEELGDLALMIRPTFNMAGQDPIQYDDDIKANVGPEILIAKQLGEYEDADVETLGTDLYRMLSKDKTDEAHEIITQFYDEHYSRGTEDVEAEEEDVEDETSQDEDVQTTLMED